MNWLVTKTTHGLYACILDRKLDKANMDDLINENVLLCVEKCAFKYAVEFYGVYTFWQHFPLHVIAAIPHTSVCKKTLFVRG